MSLWRLLGRLLATASIALSLSNCQSLDESRLNEAPTDIPICKTEGIKSKDFTMIYEVGGDGQTMMVRDSGKGFSCRLDAITDDGFPLCEKACNNYTRPTETWGFCHGGKVYECYNPDTVAKGPGGKQGEQGEQGEQGTGTPSTVGLIQFDTTYYPYNAGEEISYAKTVCGDANAHGGFYFAITEKAPLAPTFKCNDESWRECPSSQRDCYDKWNQIPADAKKMEGGRRMVREPSCASLPCGKKFKVYSLDRRISAEAVIWDACPEKHWNNRYKEVTEGKNPCKAGGRHVDLRLPLYLKLNGGYRSDNIEVLIDPKSIGN